MASLKNIKLKILSYQKTGTVTHAMEAVSAVKMRKSQERALSGRAYAAAGLSILERLSGTVYAPHHPLMQEMSFRDPKGDPSTPKTCVIVVTSDKGLAGALNSGVIRLVERETHERGWRKSEVMFVGIGRRGAEYFANRGYEVRARYENVSDGVSEEYIRKVTDNVLAWHAAGEVDTVYVAYQNFISTFEQQPTLRQIVPIKPDMMRAIVENIRPVRGKYVPLETAERQASPATYTIEPDANSVLAALLPKLLNIAVFHALLEAKASEHSARMVAMKSATDKAKEMAQGLTRTFNKVRQAAITREVSEITSGIEAMR